MKKSDLKNGMIVECRNSNLYIVIKNFEVCKYTYDGIFLPYPNVCSFDFPNHFDEYNDNLLVIDSVMDGHDIMKIYHRENISSNKMVLLWERKEIKLTDDEKAILRNLPKEYEWIVRDSSKTISVHAEEPTKGIGFWHSRSKIAILELFEHLFLFIKWEDEKPYNIKELLEN